ncbi:hypothetical protein JCM19298_2121 [Nonlabens ulvanivorans]|nr:hypothetical protein JCM19298_2121 [Nonlabens ulvanivorans]
MITRIGDGVMPFNSNFTSSINLLETDSSRHNMRTELNP